jgi:hypothetical protein
MKNMSIASPIIGSESFVRLLGAPISNSILRIRSPEAHGARAVISPRSLEYAEYIAPRGKKRLVTL